MNRLIPSFLLLLTLCVFGDVQAQYSFTHNRQAYQPLEEATILSMPWADTNNPYSYITLDAMTFKMYGEEFVIDEAHPMGVSKWGNIMIFNEESVIIIDAFHSSIMDSIKPSARVSARVDGMVGDRILKLEWRDMGFQGYPADIATSFQMWMYERSGNTEFRYGPHTLECVKDDPTLQGGYVGMFKSTLDFSKFTDIFWIYGEPENPKVSKMQIRAMHCPFEENVVATIAAPTASVTLEESASVMHGLFVERNGSIEMQNAENVRLFNLMGQMVIQANQVPSALPLAGVASGRYFLEYDMNGQHMSRAVMIE